MPGSTARPSSTGLLTKKSSWAAWSAQPTSVTGASGCGPVALRTSTPTGPSAPVIAVTRLFTWSSSVTSAQKPAAVPPSSRTAWATAATCSSPGRPLTATANPSRARCRAITAPRPRELPVTRATRPCATGAGRLAGAGDVGGQVRPLGVQLVDAVLDHVADAHDPAQGAVDHDRGVPHPPLGHHPHDLVERGVRRDRVHFC